MLIKMKIVAFTPLISLHKVPIHEVKRRDIAARLSEMCERHGLVAAARARIALSGILEARRVAAKKAHKSSGDTKPMPAWRLHDLRRTVATRMADLGIEPHVIEAILNHVSGTKAGVAGVYNRSLYAAEKRAALKVWADHVQAVLDGHGQKAISARKP